jgi:hypothetical protein
VMKRKFGKEYKNVKNNKKIKRQRAFKFCN